mgnify:CR=1 FL=1
MRKIAADRNYRNMKKIAELDRYDLVENYQRFLSSWATMMLKTNPNMDPQRGAREALSILVDAVEFGGDRLDWSSPLFDEELFLLLSRTGTIVISALKESMMDE